MKRFFYILLEGLDKNGTLFKSHLGIVISNNAFFNKKEIEETYKGDSQLNRIAWFYEFKDEKDFNDYFRK